MDINELQNAAIEAATAHIKGQRQETRMTRLRMYCVTIVACVLLICAAVVACFTIYAQQQTIIEQQYALNMQYAQLMEYVAGAEITTETIDGSGGGVAAKIEGNGNTISGGGLTDGEN